MTRGQSSKVLPTTPGKQTGDRVDEILESIRKSTESNNLQFTQIFNRLKSIEDSQKERLDAQDKKISDLESKNKRLEDDLLAANNQLKMCRESLNKAETRIIENESHGRRLNLVFGKVPESKDENIRETINKVLIENLKIPQERAEGFLLRDIHRLGKSKSTLNTASGVDTNKPRNIIVSFLMQQDRNYVYSQAKNLKGSVISMRPDLVKEMALIRDDLLLQRQTILKFNKKLYVQLSYRSYSKPTLLVKVAENIVEFNPQMKLEDLQEIRGRS